MLVLGLGACSRRSSAGRAVLLVGGLALLSPAIGVGGPARAATAPLQAIGVENEYADVMQQIGGRDVVVQPIETDPNTDPHSFEVSPKIAAALSSAALVVENGVGYDAWADRIMAAAPSASRHVINVQHLLSLPDSTPNPHLWYDPRTMPVVAEAIARDLTALVPSDAAYFRANAARFVASLAGWNAAMRSFRAAHDGIAVAVTEPVADYMLAAAGCRIATPYSLQAAIMNGTDPSPQDVTTQNALLTGRAVKAFVYNQQVTDSLTQSFLHRAQSGNVPVVGVYETMPAGYHYQSWMVAEVDALRRAVETGRSTEILDRH